MYAAWKKSDLMDYRRAQRERRMLYSGRRGGDVLKLFKKTLSLNGSSPSFTIEKKNEGGCVISLNLFAF